MAETAKQYPATKIVQWAGGRVACCDDHASALLSLSAHLEDVTVQPAPALELCTNCLNEAKGTST